MDTLPCSTGDSLSSNSLMCSISPSILSKDSMLARRVEVEDRITGDSSVDQETQDNDWLSFKPVVGDNLGIVHDDLDMVDIDDCPSIFAGESDCNTIDFDTIIDLGLDTTGVMTDISSRECAQGSFVGQTEIISGQSCFTNSANQSTDNVLGYVDDVQDKDAVCLGFQLVCPNAVSVKTVTAKPTSTSADVPSSMDSNVPQLSSVKCELSTSFLTPKTPTHSQPGLPAYATHFSFSSPDTSHSSPVLVPRPKTPVVSISLPVRVHPQLSPHAPYTPDTPSVFQFPSPNQSPASSSGSPASRHSKLHTANCRPYVGPSASISSLRYLNQQQASVEKLEQQKRLEMEVVEADSEIDQHVRQLHLADLHRKQQLQTHETCPKEMSSKLSVTVPAETGMFSDTNTGNSTAASCRPVVSPIEEVIQIFVAEHFGITVPSKFARDDLKHTGSDLKECSQLASLLATSDGSEQHPVTEEFRNPGTVPASKPRKRKPEPLVIPASVSNFGFRSQLRSPKLSNSGHIAQQCHTTTTPPYTPPPMISPARTGSGVFWTLHSARQIQGGPQSAPPRHTSFPCMFDSLLY